MGVVTDERTDIKDLLGTIKNSDADIVISTGGVGPGKYDLFGELLPELGARILYRSLHIRPGRSTLFGLLGDKLYFGLPGPPTAVRVLFHELLCPLIKKMQGMRCVDNQRLEGFLDHYMVEGVLVQAELREQELEQVFMNSLLVKDSLIDTYINDQFIDNIIL